MTSPIQPFERFRVGVTSVKDMNVTITRGENAPRIQVWRSGLIGFFSAFYIPLNLFRFQSQNLNVPKLPASPNPALSNYTQREWQDAWNPRMHLDRVAGPRPPV